MAASVSHRRKNPHDVRSSFDATQSGRGKALSQDDALRPDGFAFPEREWEKLRERLLRDQYQRGVHASERDRGERSRSQGARQLRYLRRGARGQTNDCFIHDVECVRGQMEGESSCAVESWHWSFFCSLRIRLAPPTMR